MALSFFSKEDVLAVEISDIVSLSVKLWLEIGSSLNTISGQLDQEQYSQFDNAMSKKRLFFQACLLTLLLFPEPIEYGPLLQFLSHHYEI